MLTISVIVVFLSLSSCQVSGVRRRRGLIQQQQVPDLLQPLEQLLLDRQRQRQHHHQQGAAARSDVVSDTDSGGDEPQLLPPQFRVSKCESEEAHVLVPCLIIQFYSLIKTDEPIDLLRLLGSLANDDVDSKANLNDVLPVKAADVSDYNLPLYLNPGVWEQTSGGRSDGRTIGSAKGENRILKDEELQQPFRSDSHPQDVVSHLDLLNVCNFMLTRFILLFVPYRPYKQQLFQGLLIQKRPQK